MSSGLANGRSKARRVKHAYRHIQTPDTGFEVCLGIPFEACRGWYLLRAAETHDLEEQQPADLELLRTCHA
jgi:hypothetical protein